MTERKRSYLRALIRAARSALEDLELGYHQTGNGQCCEHIRELTKQMTQQLREVDAVKIEDLWNQRGEG